MDYHTFFELSPNKLKPFGKAKELKRDNENELCWIHGFYIMSAVASALSANNQYLEQPIDFNKKPLTPEEQFERFGVWADKFNQERHNKNESNPLE